MSPLQSSVLIHSSLLLLWAALNFKSFLPQKQKIEIEVFAKPQVVTPTATLKLDSPPPPPKPAEPLKKAVFGLSKKSIVSSDPSEAGAEVKAGNTVAKEIDDLKLDPNEDDSLPIPADEFLVTQMPRIKKEYRAPYPAEAKKAGVEGPVVMDVLVDKNGKVRQAILVSGPGYGLNEAAVAALKEFEFAPARVKDEFVAVRIRYTYRFVLENK